MLTTKLRKRDKEIFLEAAKRIDSGKQEFSCIAITDINPDTHGWTCRTEYQDLMPLSRDNLDILWDYHNYNYSRDKIAFYEAREHRVYMLLLMAAIVESEGSK